MSLLILSLVIFLSKRDFPIPVVTETVVVLGVVVGTVEELSVVTENHVYRKQNKTLKIFCIEDKNKTKVLKLHHRNC
jgi:hypothetical protein